jgi:hypothetical protein
MGADADVPDPLNTVVGDPGPLNTIGADDLVIGLATGAGGAATGLGGGATGLATGAGGAAAGLGGGATGLATGAGGAATGLGGAATLFQLPSASQTTMVRIKAFIFSPLFYSVIMRQPWLPLLKTFLGSSHHEFTPDKFRFFCSQIAFWKTW